MKNLKSRNFVSLFIAWSGLISIVSGIILYLAPAGRVAYWVNWHLFGLTKKQWQGLHTVSSFFLAGFVIWHLILNWSPFVNYMKDKMKKISFTIPEFLWSLVLAVVLTVMSIFSIPPVSYIVDFGDYLTEMWETKTASPIIPHAERLTLKEFCEKINFPVERAIKRLTVFNVKGVSPDKTLEEIAKENNLSPKDISDMLNLEKAINKINSFPETQTKTNSESSQNFKSDSPVNVKPHTTPGQGFGGMRYIGRMTLKEFCEKSGIDLKDAKNALKDKGFSDFDENATLREIARENGLIPRELGELLYSLKKE